MENKYFNQALGNFVHDAASGGAIRHLADLGKTVDEICAMLDFPTPRDRVADTVWKYYLEKGIILMEAPAEDGYTEKVSYVRDRGKYGSVTFRRVVERIPRQKQEYIACDFGRQRYRDEKAFYQSLSALEPSDRDYILGLPWPLTRVYHVKDERMTRISNTLIG